MLSSGAHPTLSSIFRPIIVSNLYWIWTGKWDNIRFADYFIFHCNPSLPNKISCSSTIVWLDGVSHCFILCFNSPSSNTATLKCMIFISFEVFLTDFHEEVSWSWLPRITPDFYSVLGTPHRAATAACPKWHTLIGLGTQLQRVGCSVWCSIIYLFEYATKHVRPFYNPNLENQQHFTSLHSALTGRFPLPLQGGNS